MSGLGMALIGGSRSVRDSSSNRRQPACVLGIAAADDVEKSILDALGDRAAIPRAEGDAVELADGGDFGRRAGKEGFVSDVNLVAGDALFLDGQA